MIRRIIVSHKINYSRTLIITIYDINAIFRKLGGSGSGRGGGGPTATGDRVPGESNILENNYHNKKYMPLYGKIFNDFSIFQLRKFVSQKVSDIKKI